MDVRSLRGIILLVVVVVAAAVVDSIDVCI
jgi:hypothetical protein